ncbi:MAG: hypothetical protein M1832_000750 [Thelocarpon impressellum]|nr:MAG: hypothetical protein M1832_000750 [Thelocarpon impressellum]
MTRIAIVSVVLTYFLATASAFHLGSFQRLVRQLNLEGTCTSTMMFTRTQQTGPTSTFWATQVKSTTSLDCGGCAAVTREPVGGNGPLLVTRFPTTVKMPVTTTTVYVCKASSVAPPDLPAEPRVTPGQLEGPEEPRITPANTPVDSPSEPRITPAVARVPGDTYQ